MEDLERYLTEIVQPTIDDFTNDPLSVRLAFIACVVTFHSVDYLAYPARPGACGSNGEKNQRRLRPWIRLRTPSNTLRRLAIPPVQAL
jgi:hypothetical protein